MQYGASLRALGGVLLVFQHVPVARTAQLIGDLIGASPSAGWVISALGEATAALADVEKLIKSLIMLAHVVHVDETSVNINGARWWLHVAGNDKLTAYHLLSPADAPSWPSSRCCPTTHGIAVRDALSVDDTYPTPPTLCGAHVAREQDSWQGPFLAGLTIEESDRHGETAGVPGRGEGPDRAVDPGR